MLQMVQTKLMLYLHAIRYLQLKQIFYRAYYAVKKVAISQHIQQPQRSWPKAWSAPYVTSAQLSSRGVFSCFGESGQITDPQLWNSAAHTKLWLYHLHYFDVLNGIDDPAQAIVQTYFQEWLLHNPCLHGNGWEPYPISLRVVNWIKWFSKKNNPIVDVSYLESLTWQAEVLIKRLEYHILGNHLFANAKALIFLGTFFSGMRAETWLHRGLKILQHEMKEQFLADGGHFERSPMYHATLLWDLCDLINLAQTSQLSVLTACLPGWNEYLKRGFKWLMAMTHPDGDIAFFNDATLGVAPTLKNLRDYCDKLGIEIAPLLPLPLSILSFENTGYHVVDLPDCSKAILDIAQIGPDYQPGHAHADTLSFELSLYGQRFIVNSGISQYGSGPLREFQRSTRAHNTVCIDQHNSSEVWAGFRVARRAYPRDLSIQKEGMGIWVSGAHNGYLRLPGKHVHQRGWHFSEQNMVINDIITGEYIEAEARIYFHPNVKVYQQEQDIFVCELKNQRLVRLKISGAHHALIECSSWFPAFGVAIENNCLNMKFKHNELTLDIHW